MTKKICLLLILLITSGCTTSLVNSESIEENIKTVIDNTNEFYNKNEVGYRYYLPLGFKEIEKTENTSILKNDNYKYYLYIDTTAYYNKVTNKYEKTQDIYYEYDFTINDLYGYVTVTEKNNYFYVKMMYNYSIIETKVKEKDIKEAITASTIILSSTKFNDSVIKNMYESGVLKNDETLFELEEAKTENKDDVLHFDGETEEDKGIYDPDIIG